MPVLSHFTMKTLRHRELESVARGHTASNGGNQDIQNKAHWPNGPLVEMFAEGAGREGTGETAPLGWSHSQLDLSFSGGSG